MPPRTSARRAVANHELTGKRVMGDRVNDIVRELIALIHLVKIAVRDGFLEVPDLSAR